MVQAQHHGEQEMQNTCFYYLPDYRRPEKGHCAYEGFQRMTPHPRISNRWILHPDKNPLDHVVLVNQNDCREGAGCPWYSLRWRT